MNKNIMLSVIMLSVGFMSGCALNKQEVQLNTFIDNHVQQVKPLAKEAHLAYWEAATTGKKEAYDMVSELELQIRRIYSDPNDYATLKQMQASGDIKDPLLVRQLDMLVNAYLQNQIEPDLLNSLADRINKGSLTILSGEATSAYERYLKLLSKDLRRVLYGESI